MSVSLLDKIRKLQLKLVFVFVVLYISRVIMIDLCKSILPFCLSCDYIRMQQIKFMEVAFNVMIDKRETCVQ